MIETLFFFREDFFRLFFAENFTSIEIYLAGSILILLSAWIVDLLAGDPKGFPHPVIGIGKAILYIESKIYRTSASPTKQIAAGSLLTFLIVGGCFLSSYFILLLMYSFLPIAGFILEILIVATTIAANGLAKAGREVRSPLLHRDLDKARRTTSMIVGRDTEHLKEEELIRATVETVAENTVDGVVSPLFWGWVGGAPFALSYRAVNTLDSMVGYKNERYLYFGRISARLDDILNYLPARICAYLIWFSAFLFNRTRFSKKRLMTLPREASKHESPNSGWPEAAVALLLQVQLGGRNYYKGIPSEGKTIGKPTTHLHIKHIEDSISLMHSSTLVFLSILSAIVIILIVM